MTDHERIWLQPKCCAGPYEGRMWCQDNVFGDGECENGNKATEYVRADKIAALQAEVEDLQDDKNALHRVLDERCRLLETAEAKAEALRKALEETPTPTDHLTDAEVKAAKGGWMAFMRAHIAWRKRQVAALASTGGDDAR